MSKRKSVGSIDYTPFVLIGLGGIAIWYVVNNFPNLFGSAANDANNQAIDQGVNAANQQTLAQAGPQTLTSSQIQSIATDIYNQGLQGNPPPDSSQLQIVNDLSLVRTVGDWYAIKTAFGTKEAKTSWFSLSSQAMDLDTWLRFTLDPDRLGAVNNHFFDYGINYIL